MLREWCEPRAWKPPPPTLEQRYPLPQLVARPITGQSLRISRGAGRPALLVADCLVTTVIQTFPLAAPVHEGSYSSEKPFSYSVM